MPDVSIFNLGGQNLNVKDATARSNAQSANTAANEAAKTANISIHALLAESDTIRTLLA